MPKRIRIITSAISFTGPWVLNATPNPGFLAGYYALEGQVGSAVNGTVTINAVQNLQLYDDPGGSDVYIGTFGLGNLPSGFKIDSIAQIPGTGIPYGNASGGLTTYPLTVSGGAVINNWDTGGLGLSNLNTVYVPATMSVQFAGGVWTFFGNTTIPAGVLGLRAIIVSQTKPSIQSVSPQINLDLFGDTTPLMMFEGYWTADASLCPIIGAVTNLTIINPSSGEFSWTIPNGANGVVLTFVQSGHNNIIVTVPGPTNSYIPNNIYGSVVVNVKGYSNFPICYGLESKLTLAITTPFDYTMGTDGPGVGVDVGGSATLQFVGNPSGIYTVVPGKTNDTLYERIPNPSSQVVKIPDPFIKTTFFGE